MTSEQLIKKYSLEDGIHKDYYKHFQSKKTVLTHRACEKIANIEGIRMKTIQILNSELTFARFLVTMTKLTSKGINEEGQEEFIETSISSIGEADKSNCKNVYYGCMAEKRGIDRCVLKLIDAHEFAFSEVDFADHNEQSFEIKDEVKEVAPMSDKQLILINELTKKYTADQKKKLNTWLESKPNVNEASAKIDELKGVGQKSLSFQSMKDKSAT